MSCQPTRCTAVHRSHAVDASRPLLPPCGPTTVYRLPRLGLCLHRPRHLMQAVPPSRSPHRRRVSLAPASCQCRRPPLVVGHRSVLYHLSSTNKQQLVSYPLGKSSQSSFIQPAWCNRNLSDPTNMDRSRTLHSTCQW